MVEQVNCECPYCGEPLVAPLDQAPRYAEYPADCPVCFCPILFRVLPVFQGRFHRVLVVRNDEWSRVEAV